MNQSTLKVRLSIFMFLQYFLWSAWYMTLGTYLGSVLKFDGQQIGLAYGAFAIGAMISPFFVGIIADRLFPSEKLLAFLGVIGGAVMCYLPRLHTFSSFYPVLILYCALYVPTLALGNSLSLHHLADTRTDFPRVKAWSAIGWIAGGATLSLLHAEQSPVQYYLAGGVSILFGLFSLLLPHTPPLKKGLNISMGEILGLDALALLKKPAFAVFILCMFLICIPLYFYFVNMGVYLTELQWPNIALRMTLAQVSDVIFLILLPVMLKRLGYKKTILIGILAWVTRYFLLAASSGGADTAATFIFAAILLHGVCYDFLFIAGQLYVDHEANERIRGAAQGFIAFILWGVGAFVGTFLAGYTMKKHLLPAPQGTMTHDWNAIWLTPAWLAVGVLIVFLIFFKDPAKAKSGT